MTENRRMFGVPRRSLLGVVSTLLTFQALVIADVGDGWGEWSEWADCSVSCDWGISTRSRECLAQEGQVQHLREISTPCSGNSSQIKSCFLKECPPDQPTARQVACSRYDKRVFSGRQYAWEPFTHNTNRCKLSCRAKGQHFYANLPNLVENGTPCGSESTKAICVQGICRNLGCDSVVESTARSDKCGVCGGDDSSCRTISGIFTSTDLKRGLNYVISIPPGSTNINITELQPSRNLLLMQTVAGRTFVNENTDNPISGEVTAAGTVFTYMTRSPTNRVEMITAPGPTNESVILQLLLRAHNAGILYTFNVPNEVSENVIQQIKHRSRPIEVPPEKKLDRHSGTLQQSSSRADALEVSEQERSNSGVSDKEAPQDTTTSGVYSTEEARNKDISNTYYQPENELTEQTAQGLPINSEQSGNENVEESGTGIEEIYFDEDSNSSASSESDPDVTDFGQAYPDESYSSEEYSSEYDDDDDELEETDSVGDESITDAPRAKEGQRNYKIHFVNDSFYANEDEDPDTPEQSESVPARNIADPSSTKRWGPRQDSQGTTNEETQIPDTSSGDAKSSVSENSEDDQEEDGDKNENESDTEDVLKNVNDFEETSTQDAYSRGKDITSPSEPDSQDDSLEGTELDENQNARGVNLAIPTDGRNIVPRPTHTFYNPKDSSYYRIPKYSQSFTFAERYKHVYDSDNARKPSRSRSNRRHRHRSHRHRSRSGHDGGVQANVNDRDSSDVDNRNASPSRGFLPRTPIVENHPARYDERGNTVSAFGSPATTSGSTRPSGDRRGQQNDRNDHASRAQRLRDRNAMLEERRRRIEEQRRQYQERLREYHERLRQRQAENEAARRQSESERTRHQNPHNRHHNYNNGDSQRTVAQGNYQPSQTHSDRHHSYRRKDSVIVNFRDPDPRANDRNHRTRVQPPIIPRVVQPSGSDLRPGEDPPRIIPRLQPTQPKYISSSNGGSVSALDGNELPVSHTQDRVRDNNYIPTYQNPRQDRPRSGPDSPRDVFRNQIPLNTLSTDELARRASYEWRISGLSECTHSCGGGAQQSVIVCVDSTTQAVITDENCQHKPRPKQYAVSCNTRPCPAQWTPSPWSSCSVTCGEGEQTRNVLCQARVSPTFNLTMSTSSCQHLEGLPTRQSCTNNPCNSWSIGNWSDCSAPCGDGQRRRLVQCVNLQGSVVPDDECRELRPLSEEDCNLGECGKGWFFSEWPDECPAECGIGEATRQIFCANDAGFAVPDSRCDQTQRPATTRSCRASRPCGGRWFTAEWSKCQGRCGEGNRRRDVLCIKAIPGDLFVIVGEENCQGVPKPSEAEVCQLPICSPQWYMTSWSQCSQSCGTGYRTRDIKCVDLDQQTSDACPLSSRPSTREVCNTQDCDRTIVEDDADCTDKYADCQVVKRARLCSYDFFKNNCCKSCATETT